MLSKSEFTQYAVCLSFSAALIAIFAYGVSLLAAATADAHHSEVLQVEQFIAEWDQYRPTFETLNATLQAGLPVALAPSVAQDYSFREDSLNYSHYKLYANTSIFPATFSYAIKVSPIDHNEFNATAAINLLTIPVSGSVLDYADEVIVLRRVATQSNRKVCRMNGLGYWNSTVEICYYTYRLATLCYVVDSSFEVEPGGCVSSQRTTEATMLWTAETIPTQMPLPVVVTVRSALDPYVQAARADLLSLTPTPAQLSILGVVLVVVSCVLALLPGAFCAAKCKRSRHQPLMEVELRPGLPGIRI